MAQLGILLQFSDGKLYVTFKGIQVLNSNKSVFVRIHLTPGKHQDLRTRSINTRKQESFDETFTFLITKKRLEKKALRVELMGFTDKHETLIGSAEIKLNSLEFEKAFETVLILRNPNLSTNQLTSTMTNYRQRTNTEDIELNNNQPTSQLIQQHSERTISMCSDRSDAEMTALEPEDEIHENPPMGTLNRRLEALFEVNRNAEEVKPQLNLNTELQMAAKEYVDLHSELAILEAEIQEMEKANEKIHNKTNEIDGKIWEKEVTLEELKQKKLENSSNFTELEMSLEATQVKNKDNLKVIETYKAELAAAEAELVETMAKTRTEETLKIWKKKLENLAADKQYSLDEEPKLFTQMLEADVERLVQSLEDLGLSITSSQEDILKHQQTLQEQLENIKRQAQVESKNDDSETTTMISLIKEEIGLKMRKAELENNIKLDQNLHQANIQAMDAARKFLEEDFLQLSQHLSSHLTLQPQLEQVECTRVLDSELSRLNAYEDLDTLKALFSQMLEENKDKTAERFHVSEA